MIMPTRLSATLFTFGYLYAGEASATTRGEIYETPPRLGNLDLWGEIRTSSLARMPKAKQQGARTSLWAEPKAPNSSMRLNEIQTIVDDYIGQFEEGYFPPLVNLARLTEEVGELARELNHQHGKKTKKADEEPGDVALELGDILFVVIVLANQLEIDLATAFSRTLEKYQVRDADRWLRKSAD